MYSITALLSPFPLIPFTTEEITRSTNEVAKAAYKGGRYLAPCFCISCFTVSVIPSINTFESSNDFMVLMISFISSFEINKVNHFPALTAPFPLVFFSSSFITFEAKLLTTP